MPRCNCKARRCRCYVAGDSGIEVTGNGSDGLPYEPRWTQYELVGADTGSAVVTVTGTGTPGDPWVIQVDTAGGSVTRTVYTAEDTWTKVGGTVCHVVCIGGGGGGGSCQPGATAGGSGGSGGAMSTAWFSVADLPDEVPIMVGQGGAGGQPISGAAQGQAGGDSWFGEFLLAPGGRGGKTQAASNQPRFPTLGGTYPEGGPGGAGAVRSGASVIPADDHVGMLSPTGGGMGEGSVVVGGGATDPGDLPVSIWAGRGGSGGLLLGAPPQPGQPGDLYGGGGGGGASTSGVLAQSFEGGDGAPGVVVVTVW